MTDPTASDPGTGDVRAESTSPGLSPKSLFTLATWFSPSFPVGAYTYSHGLELAVYEGSVSCVQSARDWISDCIEYGSGRNDSILLTHAWRAGIGGESRAMEEISALAAAFAPSAERLREMDGQGRAFADAVGDVWGRARPAPYPVAVGWASANHGLPLEETVLFYIHAFASSLVSAAIRLVPIGQTDGQRLLATLEPLCARVAADAPGLKLDAMGGCAITADIASMKHETQHVRLFRS
ncbi:MAG: urease accessory protein UreF [Pseudomonadota bacterium]